MERRRAAGKWMGRSLTGRRGGVRAGRTSGLAHVDGSIVGRLDEPLVENRQGFAPRRGAEVQRVGEIHPPRRAAPSFARRPRPIEGPVSAPHCWAGAVRSRDTNFYAVKGGAWAGADQAGRRSLRDRPPVRGGSSGRIRCPSCALPRGSCALPRGSCALPGGPRARRACRPPPVRRRSAVAGPEADR